MSSAAFPFAEALDGREIDRRLATAIALSLLFHALVLGALRGIVPSARTFAEGGAGNVPALQAVLAGPPAEPEREEPIPPEPAINPDLVAPPDIKPVESLFGRTSPPTTTLPGGGPARPGPARPDVSVAVGTLPDPAVLGLDYVAQLAQRFPDPVQKPPLLLGGTAVDYPRAALEAGLQGRFAAVVAVDASGRVSDAKLVVDDAMFGPTMLDALKGAQFAPAQDQGKPMPYWAIVEFVFTIGRPDSSASAPQAAAAQSDRTRRNPSSTSASRRGVR